MKTLYYSIIVALFCFSLGHSQVNVDIDLDEIRYLGTTSELDRSKFFTFHSKTDSDLDILKFKDEYDVGFGRRFYGPFAYVTSTFGHANYPAYTPGTTDNSVRKVSRFVATGHPSSVMRYNANITDAANYAVEYWLDNVADKDRPEFWEPMNEPFVHAGDAVFSVDETDQALVREKMSDWFNGLGAQIKSTPELANMKIVGYSSAWPSMELWDFTHWTTRMKMFIDRAGANMDAISVHPYDGVNITGQNNFRSGANSEAILDLIETYTAQKFGSPKDLMISEFGIIEQNYPATYSDVESAISIKGINHMMFHFMGRTDNIAMAIPFITDKSSWYYNNPQTKPYVPALFRPTDINNVTDYMYSYKINFFKLWEDVKGMRTHITSNNPDIQVQSFLDVNKAYIAINNLDDVSQTVNLNMLSNTTGISSVEIKSMKIYDQVAPSYTVTTASTMPASIAMDTGETVILKVIYNSPVTASKKITRTKYYGEVTSTTPGSAAPVFNIIGNTANTFDFTGVNVATDGLARLRIGIGRAHTYTKIPSDIKVNGTSIAIPTNWSGYDQATRSEFFGIIEAPFPINLLVNGTNTASVTFSDTGDQMSSLILEVENRDSNCSETWYEDSDLDGLGDPAVSQTSCARPDGYVANSDDLDPLTSQSDIKIFPVPGVLQAQDYNIEDGIVLYDITDSETGDQYLGNIRDGDFTQYKIDVDATGTYDVMFRVSSNETGGTINLYNKNVMLGSVAVTNTGGWTTFQTVSTTIDLEEGVHSLRMEYSGAGNLFNVNWLEFQALTLSTDDSISSNFNIKVYPNPAKDKLFIKGLRESSSFNIYDITGRLMTSVEVEKESSEIDLSNLSPGVYLLNSDALGYFHKFVKK